MLAVVMREVVFVAHILVQVLINALARVALDNSSTI